ncbi:hypothetical protein EST38_g10283 [Candolleomyces aberdarensis]|uniref:F-box domain-containing protein n=1 Tax=Candolleomyces aberdarensis TaxID=2316362 RepID=A0A4Q2DA88_9AGAR|nr:hypothetical protein EST38_g10283 [Candolleomyces aberdarensis]
MVKGSSRKTRKLNPPKDRPNNSRDKDLNAPSTSGRTPKQDLLIDLPLDILCEIFKLLAPIDLLQLTWTTKSFRKFLMNRASKTIWTHVLSAVEDLPPCPDDLSEPQYAYLMLSNNCHDCLRPLSELLKDGEALLLYLEARTQLCRACSLKHAIVGSYSTSSGWAEELDFSGGEPPYEVYDWSYSSPAKELTDEEWESVKDEMVSAMERSREARLKVDIQKQLNHRIDTWLKPAYVSFFFSQPPSTIIPTLHEVCLTDAFRTPLCTLPVDQDLSADLFESAIAQLPAIAEEWRRHRIEQVLTLVRKSPTYKAIPAGDITADTVLPLASTVFHCGNCNERITYPSILAHRCLFAEPWRPKIENFVHAMPTPITPRGVEIPNVPSITNDVSLFFLSISDYVSIWKGLGSVKFDNEAHQHVSLMLDALGLSGATTVDEMEGQQPYVECVCQCFLEPGDRRPPFKSKRSTRRSQAQDLTPDESVPRKRKAARWIKAIQVCQKHMYPEPHPECFAKLEGQDLVLAKTENEKMSGQTLSAGPACFMCMRPHFRSWSFENHLIQE